MLSSDSAIALANVRAVVRAKYQKASDAPIKAYEGVVEPAKGPTVDSLTIALLGDDGLPTGQYRTLKLAKLVSLESQAASGEYAKIVDRWK